jgi:hypothetical protein
LGSGSFTLSDAGKEIPSLIALIYKNGFYEISGYTFIAAASIKLFMYRQKAVFSLKAEKVKQWSDVRLSGLEIAVFIAGVALILFGNYFEAINISFR